MLAGMSNFFTKQYLQPPNRFRPFAASAFPLWRDRLRLCLWDCDWRLIARPETQPLKPSTPVWNMTSGSGKAYQDVRDIILKGLSVDALPCLDPILKCLFVRLLKVHPDQQSAPTKAQSLGGSGCVPATQTSIKLWSRHTRLRDMCTLYPCIYNHRTIIILSVWITYLIIYIYIHKLYM